MTTPPQKNAIPILFEDNHLLVVVKPAGVPVQEDKSEDPDLLNILKDDLKTRHNKPGNVFLGLVHRLDRPAGGVMVFAKTSKAASRLSEQIRSNKMEKIYLAIVEGTIEKKKDTLRDYLFKDETTNQVSVTSKEKGKEAVLEYECLEIKNGMSLVKIHLITGRPHQIRVQFASRNHPLLGDKKYGPDQKGTTQNLALWSAKLSFLHPTTKERVVFTQNPPLTKPEWNPYLGSKINL